jgi:Arc/MetJ-type ribon-helix-helix transcriptional regulator
MPSSSSACVLAAVSRTLDILPEVGQKFLLQVGTVASVKVSVSLDEQDVQWLRKQAKRKRQSVSAVLGEAVRQTRRERALDDLLRWLDAPKLTLEQLEAYRRQWDGD